MKQIITNELEDIRGQLENKKFLLVCGSTYKHLRLKMFLDQFHHIEFADYTSNPLYEQVCHAVKLFQEEKCELIVAVGGGSAIDVAKCVKLYCKLDKNKNYLEQKLSDSGIPLIAVPTTAGTGSESTHYAVIYCKGEKQSVSHDSILPDIAVLEPSVLETLPVYQKKCTMLDALCQAIESWWSVNSTDESKEYSYQAIAMIKDHWEEYIFDNTAAVSEMMLRASNYAGRAINITATTAAHAMSYKLTSLYKLPHGHAVALCMAEVWEYMYRHLEACVDPRGKEYLESVLQQISSIFNIDYFRQMLRKLEIKRPVSAAVKEETVLLAQAVNLERLKNNPVALSTDALQDMYRRIIIL